MGGYATEADREAALAAFQEANADLGKRVPRTAGRKSGDVVAVTVP